MSRPALPGGRHRMEDGGRDTLVFVGKIVAAVLLTGVLVGFVLMATGLGGGGEDDVAVTNPAVPTITDGGGPASTDDAQPGPQPPRDSVATPAVGTQTAVLAPKAKSTPPRRPAVTTRPTVTDRFHKPGARCRPDGAVAFTRRFEPLVCRDGRWQRMPFRPLG